MTFYVENETEEEFEFNIEELISTLTLKTMEKLKCPFSDFSLNVTFTDDDTIHEINKEYRNMDKSTDVLSFPSIDYDEPGIFSHLTEGDPNYFDVESGELILGDIMISLDHAHSQADEFGHSYKREIAFLLTHSLLHLSGYDHMTENERVEMERLQAEILNELGITREI